MFVYAHDFRIFGGAPGEARATKIHKVMDMAIAAGAPLISLNDGAGARIQEGVTALAGYGGIFTRNTRASGVIPQISVMPGPCAGGAAYSPALTDFVFMFAHDDEATCLEEVRYLLSLLPGNSRALPLAHPTRDPADGRCESLVDLVPADGSCSYDMHQVIEEITDDGEYLEVQERWAPNVVMDSRSVGADLPYAWPTNEIAVMGAEEAANVIFRRRIQDADDPDAMRRHMVKERLDIPMNGRQRIIRKRT